MGNSSTTNSSSLRLLNPLGSMFLRGGDNAKLAILIYHRILPEHDPFRPDEPTTEQFDQQMQLLADNFNVLPLSEAIDRLYKGSLPPRSACITFDDGYTDNLTLGVKVLKRHSLCATFFLTNGFVSNGTMWNDIIIEAISNTDNEHLNLNELGLTEYNLSTKDDRYKSIYHIISSLKYMPFKERLEKVHRILELSKSSLPENLMMNPDQIKLLHESGMEIGAHTVSHPILARIDKITAEQEIMDNKEYLENILNDKIEIFAYPNGKPEQDYSQEHVELVKKLGFKAAVSTSWGAANARCDRYQLPRFTPWDRMPLKFLLRLYQNAYRKLPDTLVR